MLDQKEPSLKLKVDIGFNDENINNSKIQHYKKIVKPSEEELKLHKEFLKREIKKNYFS